MLGTNQLKTKRKVNYEVIEISIFLLGVFFVFLACFYSYLLFHSIAELFSIVIAGGVFLVGWNSRKYMKSSFFLNLGISSLFIAMIDLIHTLAYPGMQIFVQYHSNLPTSLWIAARYLQAGSFLISSFLIRRSVKPMYLIFSYFIITALLITFIFNGLFPVCYIESSGLTPFKIISEYIIILILLISLLVIFKNRTEFDKKVFTLIISSILAIMIAELAFTFYIGVYDFSNLVGHIFKIIAFYLLYKSIIQIGIEEPFDLLFRKISRSELELRNIIKHSGAGITMVDEEGKYLLVNEKAAAELGGIPDDFIGKKLHDILPQNIADEYLDSNRKLIKEGISRSYQRTFDLPPGRKTYWIVEQPLKDIDANFSTLLSVATDITELRKAELLLAEAEERYRTAFEQSPDGILIIEPDTLKAVEFNDAVGKILGYTQEEFENMNINDYDVIETPTETRQHVEKILKEGRDDFETKFRTKNGKIKDIFVTSKVIKLLGKTYFQTIYRDITERKKAEEELKHRGYLLEERVKELTCLFNISNTLDQMDIPIEEILQKLLLYIPLAWQYPELTCVRIIYKNNEFKTPNFKKTEWGLKSEVKESGNPVGVIEVFYLEEKPPLDNGPFYQEETFLINTITDMLSFFFERKNAEEEIKNISRFPSENPNPVLRVDSEHVIYTNKSGTNLFNIDEGSPIPVVLKESTRKALKTNEIQELELKLNSRTYTLAINPIEKMNYVNIYGMDISQRKKAEENLSHLISMVSHELRTPITVLLMSIDYLNQHKDLINEELEGKLMDGISRNIQLLNQLAEDILMVSRIDENRLHLDIEEFSPIAIIEEILSLMEPIGKEKNIEFEVDVDKDIRLKGDPKRIDQIFRVMIDNAIKYSNEHSRVEIRAIKNYQGKFNVDDIPGILFQFKDYGRGIPKDDQPYIFERFFRSSNVDKITGTGLGLAIAKDLTEAHQGKIYFESEVGIGTSFYLFFPQNK